MSKLSKKKHTQKRPVQQVQVLFQCMDVIEMCLQIPVLSSLSLNTHTDTDTHFMSAECKSLQYFHFFIWPFNIKVHYHVKSAERAEKCSYSLHTCYILCLREKDLPQL